MRFILCLALGFIAINAKAEETCTIAGTNQVVSFAQFLNYAGSFARQHHICVDALVDQKSSEIQIDRQGVPQDDYSPILHDCAQLSCDFAN